jgi:hypothetical protein
MLCLWQMLLNLNRMKSETQRERQQHKQQSLHMCCNKTVGRMNLFNKNDDNYLLIYIVWLKLVYVGV